MSKVYPVWWDTTITIYNRYEDPQTQIVSWFHHTVDNCFWKYVGETVNVGETVLQSDNTICRIPEQDNFLEKYLWIKKPNDQMSNFITLGPGDLIVRGNVDDDINEYQSGKRSSDLVTKYKELQGCIEVQSVAINTGIGRNNPHYLVRGI